MSENKIICRKCGGPHFTIKCGKENISKQSDLKENKESKEKNKDHKKLDDNFGHREKKHFFKTTYRVKLSELPNDMSEDELRMLTCDWGHIVRIKLLNYDNNSTAYIDFGYENEADYFVEAIDRTPMESILLRAERVEVLHFDKEKNSEN